MDTLRPANGSYDEQLTHDMGTTTKAVVGWLLMASYVYYIRQGSHNLLSDTTFDKACRWLENNYAAVNHKYKHLLPLEALSAGSAFHLKRGDYPQGITRLAEAAAKKLEG